MGLDQYIIRRFTSKELEQNKINFPDELEENRNTGIEVQYWRKRYDIQGIIEGILDVLIENCEEYAISIEGIQELKQKLSRKKEYNSLSDIIKNHQEGWEYYYYGWW
jgi:hypothetical protein